MKKLFGNKKKKKSKPASFNSADSDFQVKDVVPRKLIMSQSTDQPRLLVTNGTNNNSTISNTISNSNKGLMHSKSQGIMKTTIPTQPAMTKRLNRPTSSPPALVMPRPRYAEPPTRAVLKSFEHEKTLLDLDPAHGQHEVRNPLLARQGGLDDDTNRKRNIHGNTIDNNPSATSLSIKLPIPTTTISTPNRSQKLTSIADPDHLPQYDTKPIIRNKKSLDSGIVAVINAKKHESLNSVTGSDDSNRVYESALESPMMASTSTTTTTNLNHHNSHATTEFIFSHPQTQRHSSPSALSGTLVPQLIPPTASDSSETVTPAGSASQHLRTIVPEQPNIISAINNIDLIRPAPQYPNSDQAPTPATTGRQRPPTSSPKNTHQTPNGALQPLHPSQDLESLQQQVLLIQQQREMDRVEYERMEQVHKERTKWMKAEIDRTQSKLLELTASKRACMSSQQQYGDDLPPDGEEGKRNDYYDDDGNPKATIFQREQRQQYEQYPSSSANTTPIRSQKSTKSGTNPSRMSRSSSKTSNGGRSFSSGGPCYRSKSEGPLRQPDMLPHEMMNGHDGGPSTADVTASGDQPAYTNGTESGNVSRQSSGRKSQQSQQSRHHRSQQQQQQQQQQQVQELPPQQQQTQMTPSTPRSRTREQRPRSKSTESRMPSQPPTGPEDDYYPEPYNEVLYSQPPSRPPSNNNRRRYHQRSASVERPHPYYYDMPYFYPPGVYGDDMDGGEMDDGGDMDDDNEHDVENYRNMDTEYRYPHPQQQHQQQQQRYDSFPPQHRQRMRHYYPQTPYMSVPMNFMPPPQIQQSMSTGPPAMQPYNNRQRMAPSRMNMEMQQQEFYGFDGPASYYLGAPPPSRRRQSQPQQIPPPGMTHNDDGFWGGGGASGGPSSFNRYPLPPSMPPHMRMDDPQRRSYWRSRPPPPSEYAM